MIDTSDVLAVLRRERETCEYVEFALDGDPTGTVQVTLTTTRDRPTNWIDAVPLDDPSYPWGALVGPPGSNAPEQLQHTGQPSEVFLWRRYAEAPETSIAKVAVILLD